MNRTERLFEDSLRYPWAVHDQRTLKALRNLLTLPEQECADFPAAVVTGSKLIVVCEHAEQLREVILMERKNPEKVYRRRLTLKRKKNPAEA